MKEIQVLEKNETWEKTELSTGKHPVSCKQVFIVKHNADDNINRFKARLVAKNSS